MSRLTPDDAAKLEAGIAAAMTEARGGSNRGDTRSPSTTCDLSLAAMRADRGRQ